jgi:hypothetical protein
MMNGFPVIGLKLLKETEKVILIDLVNYRAQTGLDYYRCAILL